jgi:hypothetical protein
METVEAKHTYKCPSPSLGGCSQPFEAAFSPAEFRMATGRPIYSPCCGKLAFYVRPKESK